MGTLIRTAAYVDGAWIEAESPRRIEVRNPATGERVGSVPNLGKAATLAAIDAAARAFEKWRAIPAPERSRTLLRFAEALLSRKSELAAILTAEQGKPLRESEAEIAYGHAYLEWFAAEAPRVLGEIVPGSSKERRILVAKEPVGVVAAITPWNFPNAMIVRKMAAALAAGCTFICKPAPETQLSALALGALAEEAGIPGGVVNVITGDAEEIAQAFMESNTVRKITFTGSTEVGKILMRSSAETLKRLTLELGGNAPFIVSADADVERAARDAIHGKYRNAGQTCICVNRFLLHRRVAGEFLRTFKGLSLQLNVGPGDDPKSDIGPLINRQALEKVRRLVRDALDRGATLEFGEMPAENSLFVHPIGLGGVTPEMHIWREEVFGPVASFTVFDSDEQAIELANATPHGLAAYLYTRDLSRAFRMTGELQYGMIGVNDTAISAVQAPFGGIKHSGFGREGSRHGIDEYLQLKYLSLAIETGTA